MKRLTKEEALIACADQWNYVGHSGKDKWDSAAILWPQYAYTFNGCWACTYREQQPITCNDCLIRWADRTCMGFGEYEVYLIQPNAANAWAIRDLALVALGKLWRDDVVCEPVEEE